MLLNKLIHKNNEHGKFSLTSTWGIRQAYNLHIPSKNSIRKKVKKFLKSNKNKNTTY